MMQSQGQMSKLSFRWVFRLALTLLLTLNFSRAFNDRELKLLRSCILSIKLGCQARDLASAIINRNSRHELLERLIAVANNSNYLDLSNNALIILGDLTASAAFPESVLFVDYSLFTVL